ncbi:MAG: DMT family transporter [Eubacteriales bacterium]|nr:DMT family transporter [Eubacteriales bacterium]
MNEKRNDTKSLISFIGSMLVFGTVGIFRRYIPLPSALLACCRGVIGSAFLLILAALQKGRTRQRIGAKKTAILAFVGALIGINWLLLFEAYNYTTVATATLCYYMEPTIVVLLSPLVFREKLTVKKGLCALVAVIGMVFVSGVIESGMPSLTEIKGVLFGLGAAVLYAAVVMINKKLPGIEAYQKTIIQLFSAAVIMAPYLLLAQDFSAVRINTRSIVMIGILGLIHTGLNYAIYFGSMDGLHAQSVALFSYLDPVTALILSALILHETMSGWGIIGAVLILGAALISEFDGNLRKSAGKNGEL